MNDPSTLPLFILQTVLFPDGLLPLRVFEPRYVSMVAQCLRDDSAFGVVAIRSGREVGTVAACHPVGTSARIIDFDQEQGGVLTIVARGERRFRIVDTDIRDDRLAIARVEWLPEPTESELPAEYRTLLQLLEQLLRQAGEPFSSLKRRTQAGWVVGRLAELLPFALSDKQRLLETGDYLQRLQILCEELLADVI